MKGTFPVYNLRVLPRPYHDPCPQVTRCFYSFGSDEVLYECPLHALCLLLLTLGSSQSLYMFQSTVVSLLSKLRLTPSDPSGKSSLQVTPT